MFGKLGVSTYDDCAGCWIIEPETLSVFRIAHKNALGAVSIKLDALFLWDMNKGHTAIDS